MQVIYYFIKLIDISGGIPDAVHPVKNHMTVANRKLTKH